ncbi:MAG: metallophosphoesterase family protein [bacterium]|nr:metallophosphoesterase family protein [bacterium]
MKQIGILSDTHNFLPPALLNFFKDCDEIWHAGDWGNMEVVTQLEKFKPVRGVFGNIDSSEIRQIFPETNYFEVEELKVFMIHIGGYPDHYSPNFKKWMNKQKIDLMICGHSHILRVMKDLKNNWMHINPGACGNHGFQKVNTAIRLKVDGKKLLEMEVWEQKRE